MHCFELFVPILIYNAIFFLLHNVFGKVFKTRPAVSQSGVYKVLGEINYMEFLNEYSYHYRVRKNKHTALNPLFD